MYRMMIVDDQTKEIEGIRRILDWEQIGIEIVGHAKNGRKGVEEALQLKPDIIISDIVMHSMDGLEMAARIKDALPGVKFVFISCFDDFKFVSQAINNGAFGYVLKPILPGELLNAITKILNICDQEKKNYELLLQKQKINESIAVLRENFHKNLLYGLFENEEDMAAQGRFLNVDVSGRVYTVGCVELECHEEDKLYFQGVNIISKLGRQYEGTPAVQPILMDLTHIALLFSENVSTGVKVRKSVIQQCQEVLDFIHTTYSISATVGIGGTATELRGISQSYREALKALQHKFYYGKMQVIDIQDVSFQFDTLELNMDHLNDTLKQILFSGERSQVKSFVEELLPPGTSPDMLKYTCYTVINTVQMLLLQVEQNLEAILGTYRGIVESIAGNNHLDSLRDWMVARLLRIIQYLEDKNRQENMDVVRKMDEYIRSSYHTQIMLQDVADSVFLSPSYANYVYKSVYGKTVHQQIEDLKLELAARLLLEEKDLKVFRVAEKAGYCNSSYFINVFRKAYGCTPSDYRRRKST